MHRQLSCVKDEVPLSLSARIQEELERTRGTPSALAKAVGVTPSYISNLLRGHSDRPSIPVVRCIADALRPSLMTHSSRYALRAELLRLAGHEQAATFDAMVSESFSHSEAQPKASTVVDRLKQIRRANPAVADHLEGLIEQLAQAFRAVAAAQAPAKLDFGLDEFIEDGK
jgi:transcriptional regulator with XRE-family HTH domain